MSRRTIATLAAGVIAGATVVGVPALAYASADSGTGAAGGDMGSMMDDPAVFHRMRAFMSEMMSGPQMQEQMRSMMDGIGDRSGMGMGRMGDATDGDQDPGTP